LSFALLLVQCSKNDEGTKYYKVDGTVTLSERTNADGAVVSLSTSPNGANIGEKTITDGNGKYTFMGVESGTYYINVVYDSNNMLKSAGNVSLSGIEVEVDVQNDATFESTEITPFGTGYAAKCTFTLGSFSLKAQDDLMDKLHDDVEKEPVEIAYTFKSTHIINNHTIERMKKNQLDFRVNPPTFSCPEI
jgi:hypothetical protein